MSHHSSLAELGWDNSFAAAFEPFTSGGDHIPARVSRVDRGGADVLGADGPLRASLGREVLAGLAVDRTAGRPSATGSPCGIGPTTAPRSKRS